VLQERLTVDASTLPGWYENYFIAPWYRLYTLNADDLAGAASRHFSLPRRIREISATRRVPDWAPHGDLSDALEVVHLNGKLPDPPELLTFSSTQYAERLASADPWYLRFAADLASRPFVFVGTRLEESPLWQHIEIREHRGPRGLRELRPKSFLVTPSLDRARRALLEEYNVEWVQLSAEAFSADVLAPMRDAMERGHLSIAAATRSIAASRRVVDVGSLSIPTEESTQFLMGEEPRWSDIQSNRAVPRVVDDGLAERVEALVAGENGGAMLLSGTAGSGKSTALMRLALRLTASGNRVGWIDRTLELPFGRMREQLLEQAYDVVLIDDADIVGAGLAELIRDVGERAAVPSVVVAAIRSSKVERAFNAAVLEGSPTHEVSMPPLEDRDIGAILDVLDLENRLGVLRGRSRDEQEAVFREYSGRQLLVAMIEATSGMRFQEKVREEFLDLPGDSQFVYALVAVSSALRHSLSRDELLIGTGDQTNAALNALDALVARGVIIRATGDDRQLRARHRVIAEILLESLQEAGKLAEVLRGLALVAATKVSPGLRRSAKPWKFLRSVINHRFLLRTIGGEQTRILYASIEKLLQWDSHYWLQRGSLEVRLANRPLAENFLGQARGLAPDDALIQTEWALLLFRKALASPTTDTGRQLAAEAEGILRTLIADRAIRDTYPYHVLGTQGLSWCRRAVMGIDERKQYLKELSATVEQGALLHPNVVELQDLSLDLKRALLALAADDEFAESRHQAVESDDADHLQDYEEDVFEIE
jgi:hypothetical protein